MSVPFWDVLHNLRTHVPIHLKIPLCTLDGGISERSKCRRCGKLVFVSHHLAWIPVYACWRYWCIDFWTACAPPKLWSSCETLWYFHVRTTDFRLPRWPHLTCCPRTCVVDVVRDVRLILISTSLLQGFVVARWTPPIYPMHWRGLNFQYHRKHYVPTAMQARLPEIGGQLNDEKKIGK